jgi:hypothetical protein
MASHSDLNRRGRFCITLNPGVSHQKYIYGGAVVCRMLNPELEVVAIKDVNPRIQLHPDPN